MRNILIDFSTLFIGFYVIIGAFICTHQLQIAYEAKDLPRWYHLIWGIPAVILFWPKQYWDKIIKEKRQSRANLTPH